MQTGQVQPTWRSSRKEHAFWYTAITACHHRMHVFLITQKNASESITNSFTGPNSFLSYWEMEQAHCGQDTISGYCNYCTCECVHAPIPHIETQRYFHNATANFRMCSIFSLSISKVIELSPVLLDMLASESLKTHVLPILLHLPSDFCLQSKMSKWQFLWLACNSSVLVADKDNCHSTRTLQSTSNLSLETTKTNTGISTYNFCDAHVSSSKSCMTVIQTCCTQKHSPEVT